MAVTIPSINNANFADTVRCLAEGLKPRGLDLTAFGALTDASGAG